MKKVILIFVLIVLVAGFVIYKKIKNTVTLVSIDYLKKQVFIKIGTGIPILVNLESKNAIGVGDTGFGINTRKIDDNLYDVQITSVKQGGATIKNIAIDLKNKGNNHLGKI